MDKTILETTGAIVIAIVILGIPILSFVSFVHNWNASLQLFILTGLTVDFLYVANKLIGEKE